MEYTENYSLKKPAASDFYNVEDFNDNADAIDERLYVGEQAYTLVNQLLTRVQTLESENTKLKQKAKITLDVYAPQGTAVTLSKSGSSSQTFTVGSTMLAQRELDALGEWAASYTYGGITYSAVVDITDLGVTKIALAPTLEASPWAFIDKVSQAGLAASCWVVGDTKTLTTETDNTAVRILGFDHDILSEPGKGNGKRAGITFALVAPLDGTVRIHSVNEVTDWADKDIVTTTLPDKLEELPADLQAAIKTVGKMFLKPDTTGSSTNGSDAKNGGQMLDVELFLLSEREIFGAARQSSPYYGFEEQYEYYKRGNDFKQSQIYWLRGVPYDVATGGKYDVFVRTDGTVFYGSVTDMHALLYGFCV